jgi:glycosyltransferase involved in cell wall biosynthesis
VVHGPVVPPRVLIAPSVPRRRLRILKYPWHTAHDYELSKLEHDFLYLSCTPRRWATEQRPVPSNIQWVPRQDARKTDLMILHVDQWTWNEPSKRFLFLRFRDGYAGPKIVINHGCNLVDGMDAGQLRELLGDDVFMVANSSTAAELWGYPRSRFIRHGMSPEEWPQTDYARHEVIVVQAHGRIHAAYRNHDGVKRIEETVPLRWVGRDIRFDSFNKYRHFLQSSSIFLQPSHASPNPRSRTEAMLSGLAVVTTNTHGEDEYIENGVNGFCSNDEEELADFLQWLLRNPERTREIGRQGRETAQQVFHIDNFVDQWHTLLAEVMA